jgi:putative ABC transport system ATP-binding protein
MSRIIETQEISKVYKMGSETIHALKSISIAINKGEYVAFMGPSGSGKSTLMNIIGCLDTPTAGRYILNNNDDVLDCKRKTKGLQNTRSQVQKTHYPYIMHS